MMFPSGRLGSKFVFLTLRTRRQKKRLKDKFNLLMEVKCFQLQMKNEDLKFSTNEPASVWFHKYLLS